MTLKTSISDRELDKFVEINGQHVVRTIPISNFSPPALTDAITVTYPDSVTEVYQYRSGGTGGTILNTVTIVYTNSTKKYLLSAVPA